jgi:18S rRNA (guanine1575-N7)-methyltransferase
MTYRALELLSLPPDESKFILDIGCGSGLSGEILEEEGHYWVGVDIAPSMLGECECFWTSHRGKLSSWVILLQRLRWREK